MLFWYNHINPQNYVRTADGRLKVHQIPSLVPLVANVPDFQLEDSVRLLTQYCTVGLWVDAPESTPQLLTETLTCASGSIFNSAYLNLRDNDKQLFKKLSLLHIKKANDNGHPFFVNASMVNLAESTIEVKDNPNIVANTAIQIRFDYVIPTKKHLSDIVNNNK